MPLPRRLALAAVALVAAVASACGSDEVPTATPATPAPTAAPQPTPCFTPQTAPDDFHESVTLGPASADGLQYAVLRPGCGATASSGQKVSVQYTGWLENGTKFDSSRDRGQPFSFTLGQGQVIKGWDEGVAGMKVGEKRRLVIPAPIGYGAAGQPPTIPANATLVFDVELLSIG